MHTPNPPESVGSRIKSDFELLTIFWIVLPPPHFSTGAFNHGERQETHLPGEKFLYSDSGFFILQQIFEKASGHYCPAYTQEHIFSPLEMANTKILEPTEIVPGRTVSYCRDSKGKLCINVFRQLSKEPRIGDNGTTIEDFVN